MVTTSLLLNRASVLLLLAALPILVFGGENVCPKTNNGSHLSSVSVFDGSPDEQADLVPDSFRERKGVGISTWDVAYIFESGRKLFVECKYGANSSTVTIEPDAMTSQCVFLSGKSNVVAFSCK